MSHELGQLLGDGLLDKLLGIRGIEDGGDIRLHGLRIEKSREFINNVDTCQGSLILQQLHT